MATWYFNLAGHPIAFAHQGKVYNQQGIFIGRLQGNEVWKGDYVGELVSAQGKPPPAPSAPGTPAPPTRPVQLRLLKRGSHGAAQKAATGRPLSMGVPGRPGPISALGSVSGFSDITV
jgi:hypothetical protein